MKTCFLLGPAGSGKTYLCLEEIRAALAREPDPEKGGPLILIAPKQATFQLERQLLAASGLAGFSRLQILTFDRLAQYVFTRLGEAAPPLLSGEGRLMVLRALLHHHAGELKLFSASARRYGFAQELGTLLAELQQQQFTPAKLRSLAANEKLRRELRDKLLDLALILEHYQQWLRQHDLAAVVMRNVTSRDAADKQQPYNLHVAVPGGITTIGSATGTVYDIAHVQFFQADQIRGLGNNDPQGPYPGRRVLAEPLHDASAMAFNPPDPAGPNGSQAIHADGSVAAFMPVRRALAWQSTDPVGTPVVRERYWITMQPGEIRVCDGCHGVNTLNQAGQPPAQNTATAFRELLHDVKDAVDFIFDDGFGD